MNTAFENKKAIVIGGSSGIGLATAQMLAGTGALVTVTGRDENKLKEVQQATGLRTQAVDSNDRAALDAFFSNAGKIDHLVIAVSGSKGMGAFNSLSLQDLRDGFDAKFWPQLETLQADEIPRGIELEYRRCGRAAAFRRGGIRRQARFGARGQRIHAPMDEPDVVACVDRDAGDRPENPVVGKRLGPERIDAEGGCVVRNGAREQNRSADEKGRARHGARSILRLDQ